MIKERIPDHIYRFDYNIVKNAKNIEDVISKLPVTSPEHYIENINYYNEWIAGKQDIVSAIVLSSGTVGEPKIFTYTIYDGYRDLVVVLRSLKYLYQSINLFKSVFIAELATAYPVASTAILANATSIGKIPVIPTFLKDNLDNIIIYLNKFLRQHNKILLGYTTQLLYVTPKKFKSITPCDVGFSVVVPAGEPITSGAYVRLREIYCSEYVIGLYGSTEARIHGIDNGKGEYHIYSDRTLIAVLRDDGTIGVDGEGELIITPLYVKGEIPGTILPMYRIGDRARVKYEDGMYIVKDISRTGDELQIGAANFNPIVMGSLIERELIRNGFREVEVLFVLKRDPLTGLIRVVDVNVIAKDADKRLITSVVREVLGKYSEVLVVSEAGLIELNISVHDNEEELLDRYAGFKPFSYHKGKKYIIIDQK